jgi:hypothetical protein
MTTLPESHTATALVEALAQRCDQATLKGDSWTACCPAHDDTTPSLSITPSADGTKALLHCFAGCTLEAILAALGLTTFDLGVSLPPAVNGHKRIVKVYDYVDAHGTLVHQTVRYVPKDFKQRRPDPAKPGAYRWNLKGIERVLYHLPAVLAAIRGGELIHLAEGEKDADTLTALGLVATTVPMGAKYWRDSYTTTLTGAHVILWPDSDQAGQAGLRKVQRELTGKAQTLRVVQVPRPHKDVSAWIEAGGTPAEAEALVEAAIPPPPLVETAGPPVTSTAPVADARPVIQIGPDITRMVDAGQAALLALPGPALFQRARRLSLIARGVKPPKYLHRPADAPVIVEAQAAYLDELATIAARWEKLDKRKREWEEVTPPSRFVQTLQARPSWPFPLLEGIIHSPTLRPDGSLLDTPGFDPDTGLLFDSSGTTFPPLPVWPTLDDARSPSGVYRKWCRIFPLPKPATSPPGCRPSSVSSVAIRSWAVCPCMALPPRRRAVARPSWPIASPLSGPAIRPPGGPKSLTRMKSASGSWP